MKTLIIIPSRMSAKRLPGKPLLEINGLSIISHVFKRAEKSNIGEVIVAAEDQEIIDLPFILSKGFPGSLTADILEGIIINVFIAYLYLFRL